MNEQHVWVNAAWTGRRTEYECTTVVAVVGTKPTRGDWKQNDNFNLRGLTMLYRQAGDEFYGHL
jgi:hypothetical protein